MGERSDSGAYRSPDLAAVLSQAEQVAGFKLLGLAGMTSAVVDEERATRSAELLTELAARSGQADAGIDRDVLLNGEVEHNGWGITDA